MSTLQNELAHCYGTLDYYKLVEGVIHTDGIKTLILEGHMPLEMLRIGYSILEVAKTDTGNPRQNKMLNEWQFWTLEVKGRHLCATCRADEGMPVVRQLAFGHTSLYLPDLLEIMPYTLFAANQGYPERPWVLYISSEH